MTTVAGTAKRSICRWCSTFSILPTNDTNQSEFMILLPLHASSSHPPFIFRRGSSARVRQGVAGDGRGRSRAGGFLFPHGPTGKSTTTWSRNIIESYNQTFSSDVCEKCKKYFNFHHLISILAEKRRKRKELMWLIELYGHQKQDILGHLQVRHWKERLIYWFIVSEIYRNVAVFVSSRNAHSLPGESVAWRAKTVGLGD